MIQLCYERQPLFANSPHVDNAPQIIEIRLIPRTSDLFGQILDVFLVLSAMSMPLSSANPLDNRECFFDHLGHGKLLIKGTQDYTCILLAQNYLDISGNGSRWIGLMLADIFVQDPSGGVVRAGPFIGPRLSSSQSGWERKEIIIR
jgi:hypothetical protein